MTFWLLLTLFCTASPAEGEQVEQAIGGLEIVLPPEKSPQPPFIHCQEELVALLERDRALRVSRGFVTVRGAVPERLLTYGKWTAGNDGWMPAGDTYWLHLDEWFIQLEDPLGVPILRYQGIDAAAEALAQELGRVARRELWHRALMDLEMIHGDLAIEAHLELPTEEEQGAAVAGREMRGLRVRGPMPRRGEGAPWVTLVVRNLADRPVHLSVVQVGRIGITRSPGLQKGPSNRVRGRAFRWGWAASSPGPWNAGRSSESS